jgi:hypothetical protein
MNVFIRTLLLGAVVALPLLVLQPAPAQADDYWDGYWSWYDTTYRPYYHRYYSYDGPYYGRSYSYYPRDYSYYGRPYGPPYARAYGVYGPRADVGIYGGPVRADVRIGAGPVRFGWR